jgi:hypothetical protein
MQFFKATNSSANTEIGVMERALDNNTHVIKSSEIGERKLPLSIALPLIAGLSFVLWLLIGWLIGIVR